MQKNKTKTKNRLFFLVNIKVCTRYKHRGIEKAQLQLCVGVLRLCKHAFAHS